MAFVVISCVGGSTYSQAYTEAQRAKLYVIYLNKARLAERMGDNERAAVEYQQALEMRPSDELAYTLFDNSYDKSKTVYQASADTTGMQRLDQYRQRADRLYYQPANAETTPYYIPEPTAPFVAARSHAPQALHLNDIPRHFQPNDVRYPSPSHEAVEEFKPISESDSYWKDPDGMWVKTSVTSTQKNETAESYMPAINHSFPEKEVQQQKREKNVNLFKKTFRGVAAMFKGKGTADKKLSTKDISEYSAEDTDKPSSHAPIVPKNKNNQLQIDEASVGVPQITSDEFNGFRWLEISWEKKQSAAREAAKMLENADIQLTGDASDYVLEVNKVLADHPEMALERFEVIFAKAVNDFELKQASTDSPLVKLSNKPSDPTITPSLGDDERRLIKPTLVSEPIHSEGITVTTSVVPVEEKDLPKPVPAAIQPIFPNPAPKTLVGSDWAEMSDEQRLSFIKSVSLDLHRAGVPMHSTHEQHIVVMNNMIDKYPVLQTQSLVSIFSRLVNESQLHVKAEVVEEKKSSQPSLIEPVQVLPSEKTEGPAPTFQSENLKATAWLQMDYQTKKNYVASAAKLLEQSGIRLTKPHQEYAFMLDDFLKKYPESVNQELSEIFARVIYVIDPDARRALEAKKKSQKT